MTVLLKEKLLLGGWSDGEVFLEWKSLIGFGGICYGHKSCRFTIFLNIRGCNTATSFMQYIFDIYIIELYYLVNCLL